ncbi:hypothetical protein EZV62_004509 [Acer yangbiense]|uniref:CCHC-type domain-containing protein n=1 Tax=Acer yangbiense TaxID=1000413 RepID=A0A5C7IL40_9ROSI|nr:hypothetical protein EZV62_004509 [Acer yangbiense]
MDPDEIARLCESLSIHSKSEKLWSVKNTLKEAAGKKLDLCLVGKILSRKHVNREAFWMVMPLIWQTAQGFDIEVVQDNTFLFYFRNKEDFFRIFSGGPWSFDGCLMVLEKLDGVGKIVDMSFNRVSFWIQIHNAPLLCMTKEMGEFIGQLIGEVVDIDVGSTGECFGKYMRIRVVIDVSMPLKRFLRVELDDMGTESMLLIRYEKIPKFCFQCGLLGHGVKECSDGLGAIGKELNKEFEFGAWLRASGPPSHPKTSDQRFHRGNEFSGRRSFKGMESRTWAELLMGLARLLEGRMGMLTALERWSAGRLRRRIRQLSPIGNDGVEGVNGADVVKGDSVEPTLNVYKAEACASGETSGKCSESYIGIDISPAENSVGTGVQNVNVDCKAKSQKHGGWKRRARDSGRLKVDEGVLSQIEKKKKKRTCGGWGGRC